MAVGLPLKTTYANGDVYSASDVNDTNGTINAFLAPSLATSAGKNKVINGGFDIWQRGTSITGASKRYTADRWSIYAGSGGSQSSSYTITRQSTSDTTNLPFIQYCARYQRNSGSTSAQTFSFAQSFETVNSIPLAGQAVTISFYARKGANYSPTSSLLNIQVTSETGTDQYFSDYATYNDAINQSATLTTTWQRFSYSGTFATNANEIALIFNATPTGTAGANDYFEVTGVQLELGSVATTFSRAGAGGIQGELAACQRYYYRVTGSQAYNRIGFGSGVSSTAAQIDVIFPVTMRVVHTAIDFSTLLLDDGAGGAPAVTNITSVSNASGTNLASVTATVASGVTTYRPYHLETNNSTSGFLGFSAEL
jgi:hypothetical protein